MRFRFRISLLWLLVGFLHAVGIGHADEQAVRPNIVLVLADDMGYGDARCYNPKSKCPTPHIDAIARAGLRLTDAHAAGAWCTPSRYGLLTGRYPFRTSLAWQERPVIEEGIATIADILGSSGYETAMIGKWHLGFDNAQAVDFANLRGGPCDRGFHHFFGMPASLDIPDYYWIVDRRVPHPPTVKISDSRSADWNAIQGRFWRGGLRGQDFDMEAVLDRIADETTHRLGVLAKRPSPFFLYVALTSPHTPWLPGKEHADADGAGLYSQFVAHTDAVVGRIDAALDHHDLQDNTLFIFTSDNGPVWYASDTQRFGHDAMGGLRGMKGDVWEAGHRVPFLVRWPPKITAGRVDNNLLSFVDVHPTLAEFAGVPAAQTAVDGISQAAVWRGEANKSARTELICFQEPIAIRSGDWKLITRPGSAGFLSHDRDRPFLSKDELNPAAGVAEPQGGQLYDLATDPAEQRNLWNQRPGIVTQLQQRLQELSK